MVVRPGQCVWVDVDCDHDVRVFYESLDKSAANAPPSSSHYIGTTQTSPFIETEPIPTSG